ncbi:MAG: hypothetical protein IKF09_05515 [Clostridiales bacterium]|nr:hypothetical protein [Clostridiales bacterium]
MIVFNCTVKDIFRRPYMIDSAVRTLANNGYAEHAVTYSRIRDNIKNAMEYASSNMRDYEYKAAVIYLQSRESEQEIANTAYYTHRTIRRYVRKVCDLIGRYYYEVMGIKLLPVDTRYIDCVTSSGTFWDKVNSLMDTSIENALVAIVYFNEHKSINHICSTYRMGSDKVKRIIDSFGSVVTLYDIPSEKRSAV